MKSMEKMLLRLPEKMRKELNQIKEETAKPVAVIIREAVRNYTEERKERKALQNILTKLSKENVDGDLLKELIKKIGKRGNNGKPSRE